MIDKLLIFAGGNVPNDGRPVPPLRVFHANHIGRVHVVQHGIKLSTELSPMKKPIEKHADAGSGKSSTKKRRHDYDCELHSRIMVTPLGKTVCATRASRSEERRVGKE